MASPTLVPTLAQRLAEHLAKDFEAKVTGASVDAQCDAFATVLKTILTLRIPMLLSTLLPTSLQKPISTSPRDTMNAFCEECLVPESGAELKLHDLLTAHKEWFKSNSNMRIVTKSMIIQMMTDIYGMPVDTVGKVWGGVRLKEEEATP